MEGAGAILRKPLGWGGVLLAGLLGTIMTFSYLGGFLDPVRHLEGLEVAVVDGDQPVEVAGREIDAGAQVVEGLLVDGRREVDFVVYPSRDAAVEAVRDNDVIGAVVIPQDFSAAIGEVGLTGETAPQADLELVSNDGAGIFPAQVFSRVAIEVDREVNTEVNRQLVEVLAEADQTIEPAGAATIGRPVAISVTDEISVTGRTGRGMAPFYAALMVTLTGFLATSVASLMVDVLRGTEHLEVLGRELDMGSMEERPISTWVAKAVLALSGSCLGALALTTTAVKLLGLETSGFWTTFGLAALGASAIAMVTLIFLTLFGIGGELLGVLFTTIFGVPAALGVYPAEALPPFFKFVSSWHPMHYLTDGMRSQVFYDGRADAGMQSSIQVLVIWLIGGALAGLGSAWLIEQRGARVGASITDKTARGVLIGRPHHLPAWVHARHRGQDPPALRADGAAEEPNPSPGSVP